MIAQTKPLAFVSIADRLGKLIPRLASSHDGEVVATVAAIGRILQGAGLDWHDLAARLMAETLDDMIAGAARTYSSPQPAPFTWPPKPAAAPPAPQQPKREPSPWPTFGTTSHARRKLWLKAIAREADIMATVATDVFVALRDRMVDAPDAVTTDDTRLFNRLARAAWEKGIRIDRTPSPWPTWGTLSHFGHLAMLDIVMAEAVFTEAEADTMTAFRDAYYRRGTAPGPKLVRLFNAACRNLWERGWRPEEKVA